jgi:23S rRNA (adenine2503-C2)-methyltransferase
MAHDPSTAWPEGRNLFEQTPDSLRALLAEWSQPAYRAKQILGWVYEHGATSFEQMTNLPQALRKRLADELILYESTIVSRQVSADGTIKLLLRWADGATSECVLIPEADRRTACISTQVGCPVGCVFCASGIGGLQRQLSAGQIVEQAMRVREESWSEGQTRAGKPPVAPTPPVASPIRASGPGAGAPGSDETSRLSNVVFMGLGEPLANYAATLHAVRTINADWGMGLGARKITISTVGLPTQIRRLADEKLQVNLAISLHAPDDELRKQLIPWAERVTIDSLVDAANYFFAQTHREVTLEYILLDGVNDSRQHALALAAVAGRMRSNVNLIAYNPVTGLPYGRPSGDAVVGFVEALRSRGVNAHVRRSRGLDIDGACGQLRRREGALVNVTTPPRSDHRAQAL